MKRPWASQDTSTVLPESASVSDDDGMRMNRRPSENGGRTVTDFVAKLLAFLRRHRLCVQASVSSSWTPQAAVLGFGVSGIDLNARRLARWNPSSDKGIDTDRRCDQTWSVVVPPIDHDCVLKDRNVSRYPVLTFG
jgi:hypothetical protein